MVDKVTTLMDVARLSGVSRGTVDRVLHNRPGVSEENILKVRHAIKELGYEPNVNASVLAMKKPRMIALLMPSYRKGEYWDKMHDGFVEGCANCRHLNVVGEHFCYDASSVESFRQASEALLEAEPAGVVLCPVFIEDVLALTRKLSQKGIPYIYVDSRLDDPDYLAYFGVPMYRSGYLCASLLTSGRNPEQVTQVAVIRILRDKGRKADPTLQRRMGFYEYMNEHYPSASIHNVFINPNDQGDVIRTLEDFFQAHSGIKDVVMFNSRLYLIDAYLKEHPDPNRRVVGFDSLENNMIMLRQERVSYLIAQHVDVQAQKAVDTLAQFLVRRKFLEKKEHYMHMDILTSLNCDDY